MEDKRIIDLFFERSESAIAETEQKYGRYCHSIAYSILGCDEDAEEVANDTYLRLWDTIPPKRPDSLKAYTATICRRLSLDVYKKQHAQRRGGQAATVLEELTECIPADSGEEEIGESVALSLAIERFIRTLPERTRLIFVRRYFYMSSTAEIAHDLSMRESNVTMHLLRTRKKLADHLMVGGRKKVISYFCRNGMASVMPFPLSSVHSAG